jgi:hypothetical protein
MTQKHRLHLIWKLDADGVFNCTMDGTLVAWMTPRPAYCDRGHWQVDSDLPHLDDYDGFPRYYMRREVAIQETEAWLNWRLLKIRGERYVELDIHHMDTQT